jgi:DNA-binding NarL/FixJ family response regulator
MSEPITVLLVDDHALVRQGVRAFLETQSDITVVAEADSGEEAVRLATEHAPDVALVDLIMPGMDGVEATRRLTARSPRTSVIVLTSYTTTSTSSPLSKPAPSPIFSRRWVHRSWLTPSARRPVARLSSIRRWPRGW